MKKKSVTFKNCVMIDCVSFTLVSLILAVMAQIPDMMTDYSEHFSLQLLLCTTSISVLMYFTAKIEVESQLVSSLICVLDIAAGVYLIGGLAFGWFPWEAKYILETVLILVIVYFIVSGIMYWQTTETARKINEIIKERKNGTHN